MNYSLKGKVVFITGGSTGIGHASVEHFAQAGASVVIADVNKEAGEALAKELSGKGHAVSFVYCNVADENSVKDAIQFTIATYKALHVAFNNAGISGAQGTVEEISLQDWNQVVAVNLTGVFLCMKYQIPEMLKSGSGSIINCASILGTLGFAGASAYVAAKHGLVGLTKTVALDYATRGIRVNSVGPGFIQTPMLENAGITTDPNMKAAIESLHPMNRLGHSDEIASTVVFLASDAASFITGQHIHIDGGYTAR